MVLAKPPPLLLLLPLLQVVVLLLLLLGVVPQPLLLPVQPLLLRCRRHCVLFSRSVHKIAIFELR